MNDERILISCVQLQRNLAKHRRRLDEQRAELIVPAVAQQLSQEELLDLVPGVHGIVAGDDHLTRAVLERADQLRIVSKWGVGTDSIDLRAAEELGIRVTNTPGMFGDEVADVVIGYLVMLARHLHEVDRDMRLPGWPKPIGVSLAGRTLGIIGLGDIGRRLARRAATMGMHVIGSEIDHGSARRASDFGVEMIDLDSVFTRSDVLSLNCPLTPDNRHLVNGARLATMKRGAWIINTARGGLIDEAALVSAIVDGQVGAAALDVFEVEPLPDGSPLRHLAHVILGSHNSSNTVEAEHRTSELAIDNLLLGLDEVRR